MVQYLVVGGGSRDTPGRVCVCGRGWGPGHSREVVGGNVFIWDDQVEWGTTCEDFGSRRYGYTQFHVLLSLTSTMPITKARENRENLTTEQEDAFPKATTKPVDFHFEPFKRPLRLIEAPSGSLAALQTLKNYKKQK